MRSLQLRKHWPQLLLGVILLALMVGYAGKWLPMRALSQLDLWLYDTRLAATMPNTVDKRIVVVDIDEKSLAAIGRWPWRRDYLARMMDQLFDRYKVSVVGFDIVFAEKDDSSGLTVLRQLGRQELAANADYQALLPQLEQKLDYDQLLAEHLRGRAVVLGYFFSGEADSNKVGLLPPPVLPAGAFKGKNVSYASATGYGANLPILMQNAASSGHFVPTVDSDGVTRRVSMLAEIDGAFYEPLSLAMVRTYLNYPKIEPLFPNNGVGGKSDTVEILKVGPLRIPVDPELRALVPYRGAGHSFLYVSAVDVLNGAVKAEDLAGKMVLIGTTAAGLNDLRVAPVDHVYPGVEVHANLIAGLLDMKIPSQPGYLLAAEVLQLLLIGGTMIYALLRLSPLKASLVTLLVLVLTVVGNFSLWSRQSLALPLASSLVLIGGLYALNMAYGYFFETRNKRQMASLFGQYIVPELVEKMSEDPEKYTMEGQSRELTVLFSDVRSFTSISESMDPKELTRFMNEFLTTLSEVIRSQYLGTIDKYMGDCVMAFWGAPFYDPDHAKNAVLAAMAMQQAIRELGPKLKQKGWPEIHIGVGVNTGRMTVGDMGSQIRKAYTVMGDSVNLASRLEGVTKQYGVGILVGETTREATVNDIVYREIDKVRVKGKEEPVSIFEPMGPVETVDQKVINEIHLYHQALKLYRQQNWDWCEMQWLSLKQRNPNDKLCDVFLARLQHFRKNPPPEDWDGVYEFETK